MPISGQKRQFCQNYHILWAKKVNSIPFFPIFYEKINTRMPIFYQKNVLYKTRCAHAYSLSIKRPFSQKYNFHVIFFGFFMKNLMLSRSFWSRNINSVKTTVYYRPKKSGCLVFSSIFHEKITALMPIFCASIL